MPQGKGIMSKVLYLHKSGVRQKDISKQLNTSPVYVSKILYLLGLRSNRYGNFIETPRTLEKRNNEDVQKLIIIQSFINENEVPPTLQELTVLFNIKARSAAKYFVDRLIEKGYLEQPRKSHSSRNIRLTALGKEKINSFLSVTKTVDNQ